MNYIIRYIICNHDIVNRDTSTALAQRFIQFTDHRVFSQKLFVALVKMRQPGATFVNFQTNPVLLASEITLSLRGRVVVISGVSVAKSGGLK